MLFTGCVFSTRGCGCSELDGKALFVDCRVLKIGHKRSVSKDPKVLCASCEFLEQTCRWKRTELRVDLLSASDVFDIVKREIFQSGLVVSLEDVSRFGSGDGGTGYTPYTVYFMSFFKL